MIRNSLHSMSFQQYKRGFTLVELMIGLAILGIIMLVSLPSMNHFIVKNRIENGVLELHRLALTARSSAISVGERVALCPLSASSACSNNWENELTIFIDLNGNDSYDSAAGETIIKVRNPINSDDSIKTAIGGTTGSITSLTYGARGTLIGVTNNLTLKYCPGDTSVKPKAVFMSASGRPTISSDNNNDGIDEDRNGTNIVCP